MSLTRLQMANEVLDNLSRGSDSLTRSGVTLADRVVTYLNRAQVEIGRKYDFLFKESTASTMPSQKTYALPVNINALYTIRVEDGLDSRKLTCVMPSDFDRFIPKPDATVVERRPDFYIPYKTSNQFELYPIPDASYTLRVRHSVWADNLLTDSSTCDYTVAGMDVDDVLISLATAYGWKWLGELVDAAAWRKEGLDTLKEVYKNSISGFPDWSPVGKGFKSGYSSGGFVERTFNDPTGTLPDIFQSTIWS